LFITTKLWPTDKDKVEETLRSSLKKLKLDYVDLYLVHWMTPQIDWSDPHYLKFATIPNHKVWADMERMVDLGLAKSIGVSNCGVQMLMDMMAYDCAIKPAVNQIELHPYLPQKELVDFHKKCGVVCEAYAPLSVPSFPCRKESLKGLNVLEDPLIQ
jgi:diketogulonate reductase-like aldo/keto reductase